MHKHPCGQHRGVLGLTTKPCLTECPTLPSFPSLLWHCANAKVISDGKLVHGIIVESERLPNGYLNNHILHMYGKCGGLDDAKALFRAMEERDAFSWSAIIDAHAQHGQASTAVSLVHRMHAEGAILNKFTCLSVLPACACPSSLSTGKYLHTFILGAGLELDAFLGTSLINMYKNCEAVVCVHGVFDNMDDDSRNVVAWTAMVSTCVQQDKGKQAMQLFQQMLLEGSIPDEIFFVSILEGCTSLIEVLQMHVYSVVIGCDANVILRNALVNLYSKFGDLRHAWDTFQDTSKRTVVSWTTIISAYAQCGLGREALQFFRQMLLECVFPDNVTLINVLSACAKLDAIDQGKQIHVCALGSDFSSDVALRNAILHFYGKSGSLGSARVVFESMSRKDLISWNAMIATYSQHGHTRESFGLFHRMCEEGIRPDKVTFINMLDGCCKEEALAEGMLLHHFITDNRIQLDVMVETTLIDMYGTCGGLDCARSVFDSMPDRDLVAWTAMMTAYTSNERNGLALQLFTQLQMETLLPNKVTFVSATLACANSADRKEGRRMHVRVSACNSEVDVFVGTALVDFYGKCGDVTDARGFFDCLPSRDGFSWNAMITAYAQHGDGEKALELYCCMLQVGVFPDEVTMAAILCACSHTGLVDEAYDYFLSLASIDCIKLIADHFIRLVELLGRAGHLGEGERMADTFPYQPCGTLWATLLGACSLHFDVGRGERAAYHVFELAPDNAVPYVALSNLYTAHEELDCATNSGELVETMSLIVALPDFGSAISSKEQDSV